MDQLHHTAISLTQTIYYLKPRNVSIFSIFKLASCQYLTSNQTMLDYINIKKKVLMHCCQTDKRYYVKYKDELTIYNNVCDKL